MKKSKFPNCYDKIIRSTLCSFHRRNLRTIIPPLITYCDCIFLTVWSSTFDPDNLVSFHLVNSLEVKQSAVSLDNADKCCKSICSYYTGDYSHLWTDLDFPSLAATSPTQQKTFSSSLFRSDCRNISSFSEVKLRFLTVLLIFCIRFFFPSFISFISFLCPLAQINTDG